MAAIASINPTAGAFSANEATLSAADTITFRTDRLQVLLLRNPAGSGTITAVIKGDGVGASINKPGVGAVSTSAGFSVAVPFGETRAVVLSSISDYCAGTGVVNITGGATLKAQVLDL